MLWATSDAPIANVNEFAVLVMLAEKADSDGCAAFPSRKTVARRTTVVEKTVQRTLALLVQRGLIAKGDQRAAQYLRADRRPTVYDLMIPYEWFPNIERINKERAERGRPPLTPESRPPITAAPEKVRRSDAGKPRTKKSPSSDDARGDTESPRETGDSNSHGGTVSPKRGDSQSRTGGLVVPRTSPMNQSTEPAPDAPSARSALDARRASTGSRDRAAGGSAASSKTTSTRARASAEQRAAVRTVLAGFPAELDLPARTPQNLTQAILDALASGQSGERTTEQLRARITARWLSHGHADRHAAGDLVRPVGVAVALVRPLAAGDRYGCPDPRCEDGVSVDTGEACRGCAERIADRRADRRSTDGTQPLRSASMSKALPSPRTVIHDTAGTTVECPGRDGMCGRPAPGSPSGLCARCERDAADAELVAVSGGTMTP